MTKSRRLAGYFLGVLMALAVGGGVEAQIGGLIKRKVADAVKGPDKAAEAKKADGEKKSPFDNSDILEITQPVLDGFMRGVRVEIALRKEFTAELSKHPTQKQRQECEGKFGSSPAMQKFLLSLGEVPEKETAEQAQARIKKLSEEMNAAIRKQCPADVDEVWPNGKRSERLEAIRAKAAEAAGVDAPSTPPDGAGDETESGPFDAASGNPFATPLAVAGINVRQYNILLERIKRFCDHLTMTGGNLSGGIKIPGTGKNIYWIYTPSEAATLTANNCKAIYDDILQII